MSIRVRVTRNLSGVTTRVNQMTERGQHALVNQVHMDSNRYAPMLSTDLRVQSEVSHDLKSIAWNTPYARRHYYNQMVNYSESGTGPKWFEKAKSIHLESWKRVTEAAMGL